MSTQPMYPIAPLIDKVEAMARRHNVSIELEDKIGDLQDALEQEYGSSK